MQTRRVNLEVEKIREIWTFPRKQDIQIEKKKGGGVGRRKKKQGAFINIIPPPRHLRLTKIHQMYHKLTFLNQCRGDNTGIICSKTAQLTCSFTHNTGILLLGIIVDSPEFVPDDIIMRGRVLSSEEAISEAYATGRRR